MIRLIITLIFISFLRIITAKEPTIISNASVETEEKAAELFEKTEPHQALPLVLFKIKEFEYPVSHHNTKHMLEIPKEAIQASILEGRMVKGTQFSNLKNQQNQMFFCPTPDPKQTCLVPRDFEEKLPLQCDSQPIPEVEETDEGLCGADFRSTPYTIFYSICPNEDEYVTKDILIYGFCYNTQKRKTTQTVHVTLSPLLLKSNLLYQERKVQYPFIANNKFKPLNFEGKEMDEALKNSELDSVIHPTKSNYGIQKLVPDTDMAFALWRKATYQNFNLDWQHKKLIPLWNRINNYVKSEAIQLIEKQIQLKHRTAVVDIDSEYKNDTQIFNIWVKIITTYGTYSSGPYWSQGIAILMNNFITPNGTTSDLKTSSNTAETAIKKLCKDTNNKCAGSLSDEFREVGGEVRCCPMNMEIGKLLGLSAIDTHNMPLLDIPGITIESKAIP